MDFGLLIAGGFSLLNLVVKHLMELYKLKVIAEQGREPTPEEWAQFFADLDTRRNAAISSAR